MDRRSEITNAIKSAGQSVPSQIFGSVHLSPVLDEKDLAELIHFFCESVSIERPTPLEVDYCLVLVLPLLVEGAQIGKNAPGSLGELWQSLDEVEPPSLYLAHCASELFGDGDQYFENIDPSKIQIKSLSPLRVVFREFRGEEATLRKWEYSRCVYLFDKSQAL